MPKAFLLLSIALTAFGADDPWAKVRELKSGTEIRIYKKGARQAVLAKLDEVTEDKLIIATKNEQVSIAKEDIDRLDYRPPRTGSRVKTETRTGASNPPAEGRPEGRPGPTSSSSASISLGSNPDFETIYRRTPPAPK